MIPPHIFLRILLLAVGNKDLVSAFTLADFFATGPGGPSKIAINVGCQLVGYGVAALTDKSVDPSVYLPPIVSNLPELSQYFNIPHDLERTKRLATCISLFSRTGMLVEKGDAMINISSGGLLYLLTQYILDTVASSGGGGGSIPFVRVPSARTARKLRYQFTRKQCIQCELALAGIFILVVGYIWVVVYCIRSPQKVVQKTRKVFKKSRKLVIRSFKRLRLKKRMQKFLLLKRQSLLQKIVFIFHLSGILL